MDTRAEMAKLLGIHLEGCAIDSLRETAMALLVEAEDIFQGDERELWELCRAMGHAIGAEPGEAETPQQAAHGVVELARVVLRGGGTAGAGGPGAGRRHAPRRAEGHGGREGGRGRRL
ncbi:unnamed protein product [Prorocentrum cordatum]|uniref:Uncharacterized protein n=1 Tax=Prorocentrum cordatum TaxID=2364126 RepID=A0ABN9TPS6_9DINO|nr:unnamed protein product [Polarella glacialis]